MSTARRPSISIYDYPEHLNPFNEGAVSSRQTNYSTNKQQDEKKEDKQKFWTFGRSRRKRSNSFSIKSTWNGLFGKQKVSTEEPPPQRKTTITTVSTTYKRIEPAVSKDQQEFNEALGTLARRRKYTLDETSRCISTHTVNGDSARLYDGTPQSTTTSIMGDLTPKPPARRFGQVSPRLKDKIPPLNYEDKDSDNEIPIPPKRGGSRASMRATQEQIKDSKETNDGGEVSISAADRDENENVPDDYVFKRFSQDPVRRSNLSISSCMSVSSTASGRKKRRAPLPPVRREEVASVKSEAKAAETSQNLPKIEVVLVVEEPLKTRLAEKSEEGETGGESERAAVRGVSSEPISGTSERQADKTSGETDRIIVIVENTEVELRRKTEERIEYFTEVDEIDNAQSKSNDESKSANLSRSDSFSVKDEIEKIEQQIKELESKELVEDNSRNSLQDNRRHFFQNMVKDERPTTIAEVKTVELKKLPSEQNDIHIVRLADSPTPQQAPAKVIELHIEEPIRRPKLYIDDEVNPLPKPKRQNAAYSLDSMQSTRGTGYDHINQFHDKFRGNSV